MDFIYVPKADNPTKVILVGERNPYGNDPHFALFPSPDGSSGHRLCTKILGMDPDDYLTTFDRRNLCRGSWSLRAARAAASSLLGRDLILLGSKVCRAFGITYEPFLWLQVLDTRILVLPHPSGINRQWHQPGLIDRTRRAVKDFAPDIAGLIGPHKDRLIDLRYEVT